MRHRSEEIRTTSYKILASLMDNPGAQDTLNGIVERWFLHQEVSRDVGQVREAVGELIREGFLLERQGDDRTTYYRVNRETLPEISAFIEKKR